jgi:zinc/manganese transport system substrate-binding protein
MRQLLSLILLALCLPAARADERLPVVASFSILGDLVQQVGGERVTLELLVGPGGDAHAVQPTPAMARRVAGARLLFSNGLGFEGWMARFLRSAGFAGRHVVVAEGLKPRPAPATPGHRHAGHAHDVDPHAWQDVSLARHYVARIAEGLCTADAPHCPGYRERAAALDARLAALDTEIRVAWAALPAQRRVVITSHDAFGYYGAAYGVRFLAAQGVAAESEPTPKGIAALVRQVRAEGTRALFVESIADPRVIEQVARETGVRPSGTLFSDALSPPGGPAPTYEAMMRFNTQALLTALRQP